MMNEEEHLEQHRIKSVIIERRFFQRLGPGVVTWPMKVEAWAHKQSGWLRGILLDKIVPLMYEIWTELKMADTMHDLDKQIEDWHEKQDENDDRTLDATFTVKEDPDTPFGVSEMELSSNFMDDEEKE